MWFEETLSLRDTLERMQKQHRSESELLHERTYACARTHSHAKTHLSNSRINTQQELEAAASREATAAARVAEHQAAVTALESKLQQSPQAAPAAAAAADSSARLTQPTDDTMGVITRELRAQVEAAREQLAAKEDTRYTRMLRNVRTFVCLSICSLV